MIGRRWLPPKMKRKEAPKYASKNVLKENKHLFNDFKIVL
jgi:hypothetical protein